MAKVVVIGNSGVGKSSILARCQGESFAEETRPTIGIDFVTRKVPFSDDRLLRLIMWDTCGQERYRSIAHSFYRGATAVLFVYDVTDVDSFLNLRAWKFDVDGVNQDGNLVKILVGNKSDSNSKIVDRETAARFASEHEMDDFFEVSAKTGDSVPDLFTALSSLVSERYPERMDILWEQGPTADDLKMTDGQRNPVAKKWSMNCNCSIS